MTQSLIVAMDKNGAIASYGGNIPWYLQADLIHFKALTWGHTIVMGRKTYETIGHPLPNRLNLVLTHNKQYIAPSCEMVHSVEELRLRIAHENEVFYIGGGEVYPQIIGFVDYLYITEVQTIVRARLQWTYDKDRWYEISRVNYKADAHNEFDYTFIKLGRRKFDKSR